MNGVLKRPAHVWKHNNSCSFISKKQKTKEKENKIHVSSGLSVTEDMEVYYQKQFQKEIPLFSPRQAGS